MCARVVLPLTDAVAGRPARGSIVHTAPGHGHEDFVAAKELGLDPLCPVDEEGRFTAEAGDAFVGLQVQTDGNKAVLQVRALAAGARWYWPGAAQDQVLTRPVFSQALTDAQALLHTEKFSHRYPCVALRCLGCRVPLLP